MKLPGLNFQALHCLPVLEGLAGFKVQDLRLCNGTQGGTKAFTGAVEQVLFIPDLRLQLLHDHIVPLEVIAPPWTLDFEVRRGPRGFRGATPQYQIPFEAVEADLEVCCLSNLYSRNYHHFVSEELLRAMVLEENGFTGYYIIDKLPAFAGQFLSMFGIAEERLIRSVPGPTIYRKAAFVTPIDVSKALTFPGLYSRLRSHLLGHADGRSVPLPRRLWMERDLCVNNKGRDLINRDEVFGIVERYGFQILDMPAFLPEQQIAIAHNARMMGGVHAGAFIHVLFMEPRSAIIECFSPVYVNPSVIEPAQLLEHDFSMLVSDCGHLGYQHGKKVLVNCNHLELHLQRLDRLYGPDHG